MVIDDLIKALNLAYACDSNVDDLIFEILIK
jgi:hypothetical protein